MLGSKAAAGEADDVAPPPVPAPGPPSSGPAGMLKLPLEYVAGAVVSIGEVVSVVMLRDDRDEFRYELCSDECGRRSPAVRGDGGIPVVEMVGSKVDAVAPKDRICG